MIEELNEKEFRNYLRLMNKFRPINDIDETKFKEAYNYISKYSKIFVYKIKDEIVGSITVLIEQKFIHNFSKVGHIEDVFIDEKARGKQIGTKLVRHCIEYCEINKCRKIILDCDNEVIKFYQKNGFKKKGNFMENLLI